MATKTLTITEDAYTLLVHNKQSQESFSEEFRCLLGRRKRKNLIDFFGIISEEEGEGILKTIEKRRAANRSLARKRVREWA